MTGTRKSAWKGWLWKVLILVFGVALGILAEPIKSGWFNAQTAITTFRVEQNQAVAKMAEKQDCEIKEVNTKIDTVTKNIRLEMKAISVGQKVTDAKSDEILRRLDRMERKLDEMK